MIPTMKNHITPNPQLNGEKKKIILLDQDKFYNRKQEPIPHTEILAKLLECFEPLDFEALAFPHAESLRKQLAELDKKLTNPDGSINTDESLCREREQWKDVKKQTDKLKLNIKHFLVLSVENVLQMAEQKKWGLCKNHDFIYLYNGTYWASIDQEAFQKFLGEAAEKMGVAKISARFYQFREQLFSQFLATAYLPTPHPPKDVVFINLKNGTFEITPQGINLREFDRADFITYQLPFEYNPEAKAPLFEAYLNKVLPDKDRQNILSEYLGYVFVKTTTLKLEKVLFLYGTGANGKSVCFDIVKALLGEHNTSEYSLQDLTDTKGYHRAMIANKLVNYASEISGKLESATFKQLASGEPVSARLPYGNPFEITNYAKMIFNVNELPKEVEHTNAYFRRHLIIPFDVTIPDAEQDKQLAQKIIATELSGVFNWVLDGLKRLLAQNNFTDCEAVRIACEQYETQSDSVKIFLEDEGYIISHSVSKSLKELYNEYKAYCMDGSYFKCAVRTFSERLRNSGYKIERKNYGNVVYIEKKDVF